MKGIKLKYKDKLKMGNKSKVYVDPSYMPSDYKLNLKLAPFISALIFTAIYVLFTIVMVNVNKEFFAQYSESMNFFRMVSWLLSGKVGFYVVGAIFLSIIMVALYTFSLSSESYIISLIAKILNGFSVISFALPFVIIFLIV